MTDVVIAFKAHLGWLNAVGVAFDAAEPRPLWVRRVELTDRDDREASEPYHVAGGWQGLEQVPRPADPAAVIRRGRAKQDRLARARLGDLRKSLVAEDCAWVGAVVLIGRGWMGHTMEEILGSHAHIHVAEGEAVRSAARTALDGLEIPRVDQDEKSVLEVAADRLGGTPAAADRLMRERKPRTARNWSKEERLLGLAAWLHRPV